MSKSALNGVRVLEYAGMVSGPYCAKLLADLGADVIKVEPPGGDPARLVGSFPDNLPNPEKSALFLHNNTSKRGIVLDLTSPPGKERFAELVGWADILIDNHSPGHLEGLGFDDVALQHLNPSLIYTSITPYGRTGPRADVKADELTIAHASGLGNLLPFLSSSIDRAPVKPGGLQMAYQSAITAAMVTMAALIGRRITGHGCVIDVSMQEAIIALIRSGIASSRYERQSWCRVPDRPPAVGRMKTRDGYVVLNIVEPHHFKLIRELLGNPDWLAGDDWLDYAYRNLHFMDIAPMMDAWMAQQSTKEISENLAKQAIPIGPVNSVKDILENKQYAFRHYFAQVEHPVAGKYRYATWPYLMSATPAKISRPAPLLGQHNDEMKTLKSPQPVVSKPNATGHHRLPLEGVRVADFSWVWAGPYAGMLLAMLGADVIKVEGHRRSDLMRRRIAWPLVEPAPINVPPNQGMGFNSSNLNKKSITLDISKPEGAELARQLASKCDIVFDNMRSGVMDRLGLGYEALRKLRPDIIVLSSGSRGKEGPEKDFPGYATIHSAVGGVAYLTGYPDETVSTTLADTDFMNATVVAFILLAALHHRMETGEGQFIDYSQCEGVSSLLGEMFLGCQMTGRVPERMGNAHPRYAPHNLYRCWGVDRWLALEIHNDAEFSVLAKIIGRPELAQEKRFKTMKSRKRHEKALDKIIGDWTRYRDRDSMVNELCQAGLAVAPSRTWQDIFADPHLKARKAFVNLQHPELSPLELIGVPWHITGCELPPNPRSPLLGEHNDYVFREILGLTAEQVRSLRENDIIA